MLYRGPLSSPALGILQAALGVSGVHLPAFRPSS